MWHEDQEQKRPDYQSYYPYQNYYDANGKPKKKKHTGLLVVLVVLALLSGAASWAVNVLGLRVDLGQSGMTLSIGEALSAEESRTEPEKIQSVGEEASSNPAKTTETAPQKSGEPDLDIADSPQSAENRPAEEETALSLQEIYAKVFPSVASISCIHENGTSTGTGIVMTADGYVITNYHVIEGARQIYVLLGENDQFAASLVGGDETTDIAVLKVEASGLTPAEFGDSDMLRVGDMVVAIGDPLGSELRGTMTDGIVSAINRDLNLSGRQMTLIQTNAALNTGNSGGPLINCYGQVIGINTMKMGDSMSVAGVEGLGFAIPSNTVHEIVNQLISQGFVSGRPYIGIDGEGVSSFYQFYYGLPYGLYITQVEEGSPAHQIGLQAGDILLTVGDTRISGVADYESALYGYEPGDSFSIVIYRNGRQYSATLTVGEANS